MNYTFLVVIAACLIGCGAQPYTQFQLNSYCKECMKDSSMGSVWRHPFRCDAFINCQILTNGFIAHEQPCPLGFYFDDNSLNCIRNHACKRPCGKGQKYMHFAFCKMFFECKNGWFDSNAVYTRCRNNYYFDQSTQTCIQVKPKNCPVHCPNYKAGPTNNQYIITDSYGKNSIHQCPPGEVFDRDHCDCVKPLVCADGYNYSTIQGNFRQLTHGRWLEMPCPPNLAFNMTTCVCSDFIKPFPVKGCFKISIPLKYNTEDIYKSYVQNMRVTIVKKSGKFDGGYLVLPVTANNEFRNGIEVSLSFNLSGTQKGNTVALIGNGRCFESPTFAIYIKDAQGGKTPKLVVDMMVSARKTKVTLETDVSFDTWYNVKVVKTARSAKLYINGAQVKYENVSGYVRKIYCSYGVGKMDHMSNFNGYMKDIYLSKCI